MIIWSQGNRLVFLILDTSTNEFCCFQSSCVALCVITCFPKYSYTASAVIFHVSHDCDSTCGGPAVLASHYVLCKYHYPLVKKLTTSAIIVGDLNPLNQTNLNWQETVLYCLLFAGSRSIKTRKIRNRSADTQYTRFHNGLNAEFSNSEAQWQVSQLVVLLHILY